LSSAVAGIARWRIRQPVIGMINIVCGAIVMVRGTFTARVRRRMLLEEVMHTMGRGVENKKQKHHGKRHARLAWTVE
jgi:hypothetical protein